MVERSQHDETFSACGAVSVTSASTTIYNRSRGVYIGVAQSLDFSFDGSAWVTFPGCVAGMILPIQVVGARRTTEAAAPSAGDLVFLY